MKFSIRLTMALVLMVAGVVGCNRPVEEKTAASAAQPAARPPDTSSDSTASQPTPLALDNVQPAETSSKTAAKAPVKEQAVRSAVTSPQPAKTPRAVETAPARAEAPAAPVPPAVAVAPAPRIVNIPAGTLLTVVMIDSVGTETNKVGDAFTASLAEPLVINGRTVVAKGTRVAGRVEALDEPGRVKGKAAISLVLTQLMRRDKAYAIATQPFSAQAEPETKQNAIKVGGGAIVGAVVGAIAGGKKGAAIGAAVGGGAGTTAVLVTKGQQLKIDSETKVNFVLKDDVEVDVTASAS
jgi:hypothetical protein